MLDVTMCLIYRQLNVSRSNVCPFQAWPSKTNKQTKKPLHHTSSLFFPSFYLHDTDVYDTQATGQKDIENQITFLLLRLS